FALSRAALSPPLYDGLAKRTNSAGTAALDAQVRSVCDAPSRGNDGLPRDSCSARPTQDLRPRPPRGGTGDHPYARVSGQPTPLRPSVSSPLAAASGRAI